MYWNTLRIQFNPSPFSGMTACLSLQGREATTQAPAGGTGHAPPPPPPVQPPSSAPSESDSGRPNMTGLFAQLNKGGAITSGKDMQ